VIRPHHGQARQDDEDRGQLCRHRHLLAQGPGPLEILLQDRGGIAVHGRHDRAPAGPQRQFPAPTLWGLRERLEDGEALLTVRERLRIRTPLQRLFGRELSIPQRLPHVLTALEVER